MPPFLSTVRICGGAVVALVLAHGAALAGEVLVSVDGVRSNEGTVTVSLCTRETFLGETCPFNLSAPAVEGHTELLFPDVPAGVYGVQAFHDANANSTMDRNIVGFPLEGFAFGNGVTPTVTAPGFDEAAVEIGPYGGLVALTMLYY